ncbi:MAG: glycosyltransferase family 2 protein [Candidatus Omnitrophica bacterium]|nr:glycosyltransferase family 2 protein [Candidatus Omnitrophota bacterium]
MDRRKQDNPTVSVIIPAYNAAAFIAQTIESVLAQTYKNIEVIAVDDGSTDNTRQVTAQYKSVRYIYKKNGGPASARNTGIETSKGDYLAFLDADDIWEREKISRQIDCFKNNPALGLVYTAVNVIDEQGNFVRPKFSGNLSGRAFNGLFRKNHLTASAVMIKKSCLVDAGKFDEDLEIISVEDYDLWLRVTALYEIACVNEPLTKYRLLDNSVSKNIARSYLGELKVIKKNFAMFQDSYPEIKPTMNKRLGHLFFEFGYDYFYSNNVADARIRLWQSIQHDPLGIQAWKYWGLSWLGAGTVKKLKDVKRGLRGEGIL